VTPTPAVPLIVADGDIPTTRLMARELGVVFPQVEVRVPDSLFGTDFAGRPILLSRMCHPSFSWLPDYLNRRGFRYAYTLDDNFWELTPEVDVHLAPFYNHPAVHATLDQFIRGAVVVIVWSERMRRYVSERFPGARVEFVQCGVDVAQVDAMRPAKQVANDGVVRIGYPSSRRTTVAPLLTSVVSELGAKYRDRVQFEFVGWMPETLEGAPHVTLTPQIAEYDEYLQFVLSRAWDIGLAPLIGLPFEGFKTDVKYREYATFGVPGVYSRVSPYAEAVDDGRTGILVDNDVRSWIAALERLIEAPRLRNDITEAALADMRANRDLRHSGERLAALLPR
jgi:hypothetical protein